MTGQQSQRTPALLAAGAAVVLIVSMFLEWYTLDLPERIQDLDADLPTFNAFEGLQRADVAIVVAAGLAIVIGGLVVARVLADSPAPGVALVAVGLFALAVVVYRGVISPPGLALFGVDLEMKVSFGWFVSLVAAAVIVVAGVVTYIAGPHLQFAADDSEASPEKRSTDGASRPLS
jgi:hypothetical protein